MKQKIILSMMTALALATLGSFLAGLLWSVVPMAGNTLPHHLADWAGVPFYGSALLVSGILGLLCVAAIVFFALLQPLERGAERE